MPRTIMQADEKVKRARDGIPVSRDRVYLDTGSIGPVSTVYAEALARCTEEDLRMGRALARRHDRIVAAKSAIRSAVAALLGVDAGEIELTRGTTDAIRTLLGRYPFSPGDEIVTTRLEFPPCADAIGDVAREDRVAVRIADVPTANVDDLDWLERCVTRQTRLIALSGVAFTGGLRLPIERVAEFAAARGIRTLVDGAQLVGAAALDLGRAGIDFLAMPLQKWLCGPEGLGALYIKGGRIEGGSLPQGLRGQVVHGWPVLEATAEHLAWMGDTLGWPWIHERTLSLAAHARRILRNVESIRLVTSAAHAGLVSIQCGKDASQATVDRLESGRMIVRHRPELDLLRISTAFFNTEGEIDRFAESL